MLSLAEHEDSNSYLIKLVHFAYIFIVFKNPFLHDSSDFERPKQVLFTIRFQTCNTTSTLSQLRTKRKFYKFVAWSD